MYPVTCSPYRQVSSVASHCMALETHLCPRSSRRYRTTIPFTHDNRSRKQATSHPSAHPCLPSVSSVRPPTHPIGPSPTCALSGGSICSSASSSATSSSPFSLYCTAHTAVVNYSCSRTDVTFNRYCRLFCCRTPGAIRRNGAENCPGQQAALAGTQSSTEQAAAARCCTPGGCAVGFTTLPGSALLLRLSAPPYRLAKTARLCSRQASIPKPTS